MRITGRQLRQIIKEEVARATLSNRTPGRRGLREGVSSQQDLSAMAIRFFELADQANPDESILDFNYGRSDTTEMQSDFVPLSAISATFIISKPGAMTSNVYDAAITLYAGPQAQLDLILNHNGKMLTPNYNDQDALMDVTDKLSAEFQPEEGLLAMLGGKKEMRVAGRLRSEQTIIVV